jgi:hypothetical protein
MTFERKIVLRIRGIHVLYRNTTFNAAQCKTNRLRRVQLAVNKDTDATMLQKSSQVSRSPNCCARYSQVSNGHSFTENETKPPRSHWNARYNSVRNPIYTDHSVNSKENILDISTATPFA